MLPDELNERLARLRRALSANELVSRLWPLLEVQLEEKGFAEPRELLAARQACAYLLEHLASDLDI